jgi:hypothetical protein
MKSRARETRDDMECGGKRRATPHWIAYLKSKAPSPLRSAGELQGVLF